MTAFNILLVILVSVAGTFLAEALSWFFVYRTDEYKRLKSNVEKLQQRVDKGKEILSANAAKTSSTSSTAVVPAAPSTTTTATASEKKEKKSAKEKKATRYDDMLEEANKGLTQARAKSSIAVGAAMIGLLALMNRYFDGIVVARLPFEPFGFLQTMSHRGLPGTDYYDCNMIFLYILCNFGIRGNIQRMMGTQPPKQSFFPPPQ
eukprot:TRINITY_DN4204_c0_g1_i4.p1 TRINITY_DN4204_c0_g1~~TRINITY_DN4204_c0_g1_i4.p1  ORF type:complete len:205 (+),score=64.06 TRINITY_DN4204_c0_g1_i4:28-642(+)